MHSSEHHKIDTNPKVKKPFFAKLFQFGPKKTATEVSTLTLGVEVGEPDPRTKRSSKVPELFQNRIAKWVSIKKSAPVDTREIFISPPTDAHLLDADEDLLAETQPLYASSVDDLDDDLDFESEKLVAAESISASSISSIANNQRRVGVYIPSGVEEKLMPWETTYDSMISHLVILLTNQ